MTDFRLLINLINHASTGTLTEAASRLAFWYRPDSGELVQCRASHTLEVMRNPDRFQIDPDDVHDPSYSVDNPYLFDAMFANGWVRVAYEQDRHVLVIDNPNELLLKATVREFLDHYPDVLEVHCNALFVGEGQVLTGRAIERFAR